jgi:hypothetical protein
MTATWFSALTGFPERSWAETQAALELDGATMRSRANGRAFGQLVTADRQTAAATCPVALACHDGACTSRPTAR